MRSFLKKPVKQGQELAVGRLGLASFIEALESRVLLSTVPVTWSQQVGTPINYEASFNGEPATIFDKFNGDTLVAWEANAIGPPLSYIIAEALSPSGNGSPDPNFGNAVFSTEGGSELASPVAGYAIIDTASFRDPGAPLFEGSEQTYAGAEPLGIFLDQNGDIDIATSFTGEPGPGNVQGVGLIQLNSNGTSLNYISAVESPQASGTGQDTYTGVASTFDPKTNDVLISGNDFNSTTNVNDDAVWAFEAQSGLVEHKFRQRRGTRHSRQCV